jgi:hypothetical protein
VIFRKRSAPQALYIFGLFFTMLCVEFQMKTSS